MSRDWRRARLHDFQIEKTLTTTTTNTTTIVVALLSNVPVRGSQVCADNGLTNAPPLVPAAGGGTSGETKASFIGGDTLDCSCCCYILLV